MSVKGELRNGIFVARKDSLVTKCPSKYTAKKSSATMPELGRAALVATLGLVALRRRRGRGRRLDAPAAAGGLGPERARRRLRDHRSSASVVLLAALVRHDFSFVYVAQHTSRELPTGYTISAFWGGQEGSLLLWLLS